MHLFDPDRINPKVYNQVMRKDHKSCPSQLTRCEECRVAFQTCDICVVKTTGERQRYDKNGKMIKYQTNLYLHFLTTFFKNHDQNFLYKNVIVSKGTQEFLPDECLGMLQRKGIIFD